MLAVDRPILFAVSLALAAQLLPAGTSPERVRSEPSLSPPALVLMLADQSLYLCPVCGEQFLLAYRRLCARYGWDRVWVVIPPERGNPEPVSQETWAAVTKRICLFLKAGGCRAPVLIDKSGLFRSADGGLVFDTASGSVLSISSALSVPPRKRP